MKNVKTIVGIVVLCSMFLMGQDSDWSPTGNFTFSATSGPAGMDLIISGPPGSFGLCQGYSRIFFGEALSISMDYGSVCVQSQDNWSDTEINIQVALAAPRTLAPVWLRRPGMPDKLLGYFTRTGPNHRRTLYEFYWRQEMVAYVLWLRGALEVPPDGDPDDDPYISALHDFTSEWSSACDLGLGDCPTIEDESEIVDYLVDNGYYAEVDKLYYKYRSMSMYCPYGEGTPDCPNCNGDCMMAGADGGSSSVAAMSSEVTTAGTVGIAADGEENPYAHTAIALKTIALAAYIASDKLFWAGYPILALAATAAGTAAHVTALYVEEEMDMHGPSITLFPPDPDYGGIYTDQHVQLQVLLDDYDYPNAASGIDYLLVNNLNPNPYIVVQETPGGSLPGDAGDAPLSMYFTVDVWIMPGHSLPEGYEFWLIFNGYDKIGLKSEQKAYKFWFEETTDPPSWGIISEYPNYIRQNCYLDSWNVSFGLTAPVGVDAIEFFVTGAGSYTDRWDSYDSLLSIGIDSLDDTYQTGMITIPKMGQQSWVSPGWYNVDMKLWDRAGRMDEIYDSDVLYVKPQFTPSWSIWKFTKQGSSSTFIATLYSTGRIDVDGCCATTRSWNWVNQDRISFFVVHDGCCQHFRDGSVAGDLSVDGNTLTGSSLYGPWSATKLYDSETSAMSAEATTTSICTEQPNLHDVIDKIEE